MGEKHTPGPWFRDDDGFVSGGLPGSDAMTIADFDCTKDMDPDEREANKVLAIAAPDMLAALKALQACHRAFSGSQNWGMLDDEARAAAEAAIAKAEAV